MLYPTYLRRSDPFALMRSMMRDLDRGQGQRPDDFGRTNGARGVRGRALAPRRARVWQVFPRYPPAIRGLG